MAVIRPSHVHEWHLQRIVQGSSLGAHFDALVLDLLGRLKAKNACIDGSRDPSCRELAQAPFVSSG